MEYLDEATVEAPPSPRSPPHPDPGSMNPQYLSSFSPSAASSITLTTNADIPTPTAAAPSEDVHPVIGIIHEQELGKATLSFAIPITLAILTSGRDQLAKGQMTFVLIALTVGCTAIWNAILLRKTFPKFAQVVEPAGIALVFISFNGLMAFLLPVKFLWVPAFCCCLSLMPFVLAAWQKKKKRGVSYYFHLNKDAVHTVLSNLLEKRAAHK